MSRYHYYDALFRRRCEIGSGLFGKGKSGLTLVIDFLHPFSFQEHLKTIMDSRRATGPEYLIAAAGLGLFMMAAIFIALSDIEPLEEDINGK